MVSLLQHVRVLTDLRRQRREGDMNAALLQGPSYLHHNMSDLYLQRINTEYTFHKDAAAAWQNVAHVRLEWNRVGGWTRILQNSLADLYA
eukprot:2230123-Alexandrium_andersonii.AAC.1